MKKVKLLVTVGILLSIFFSCKKEPTLPELSTIYGRYDGVLQYDTTQVNAFYEVVKIDDQYVNLLIGLSGQAPSMAVYNVYINPEGIVYSMQHSAQDLGDVNGTTINYDDGFYQFTGNK